MEKVGIRKSSILGQLNPLNKDDCEINEITWSKLDSYTKTFNNSMLLSIPNKSLFQPNPNNRHQQPILQHDANVPQEARNCLNAMLKNNFQSIVSKSSTDIGRTKLFVMDMPRKRPPIACRPYPKLLKYQEFIDEEIKLLEVTGCISKSLSFWTAPVIIIPKKSDLTQSDKPLFQMLLDYRQVRKAKNSTHNSEKSVSYYPLTNISDLLARPVNYRKFSSLDLHSGYHHTGLNPEAQPKIAFTTMSEKWQWNVTPCGSICSLPKIFSCLMAEVLRDLDYCFTFLDDIFISSSSWQEHINHLSLVFKRLKK